MPNTTPSSESLEIPAHDLLCRAHSSDEHWSGDCDFARVHITPAYARELRDRTNLFRQLQEIDHQLAELTFQDASATYLGQGDLRDEPVSPAFIDELHETGYAALDPAEPLSSLHPQGTESHQVVISDQGIWWTCYVAGTDTRIFTSPVPVDLFAPLAN